ncbi:MAG: hypothetical protein JXR53_08605 [Bacteroidales bacterium]|nr:hypothetical protein [Bacteroidales bacterium]
MRPVILVVLFFLLTMPILSWGINSDSLIEQRTAQVQALRNYQKAMLDSSAESLLPLLKMMDQVIISDENLLNTLADTLEAEKDSAMVRMEQLQSDYDASYKKLTEFEEYKLYAMIGGGGLILLFLIIIIIQASSKGKLKKKFKKLKRQASEMEEKDAKIASLTENLEMIRKDHQLASNKAAKDYEDIIQKKEQEVLTLKKDLKTTASTTDEIQKLKEDISKKDREANELRNEIESIKKTKTADNTEVERLKEQLNNINENHLVQLSEKEKLHSELQEEMQKIRREKNQLEIEMIQYRNISPREDNNEELERLKNDVERAEKELSSERDRLTADLENLKRENEAISKMLQEEKEKQTLQTENQKAYDLENAGEIDSMDMEQLKKELTEERKFRVEMQGLLEEILKKK